MRINRHLLEEAQQNASPGPWTLDAFKDDDDRGVYDAYAIRDGEDKSILDTMNSDVQRIYERDHRWDEQGRADLQLIVHLHTMLPAILDMVTWRDIDTLPADVPALCGRWYGKEWHQELMIRNYTGRLEPYPSNQDSISVPGDHYTHWLPVDFDPPPRP